MYENMPCIGRGYSQGIPIILWLAGYALLVKTDLCYHIDWLDFDGVKAFSKLDVLLAQLLSKLGILFSAGLLEFSYLSVSSRTDQNSGN